MEQADVKKILTEVRNLKTELKGFMSWTHNRPRETEPGSTRGPLFREIQGIARQTFSDRDITEEDE